jgi:hypothetical protein
MRALGEMYFKSVERSTQVRWEGLKAWGGKYRRGEISKHPTDQAVGDGTPDRT